MPPFQPATSIDEVIEQLEDIIQWCIAHRSRLGYFPVLYQSVTEAIKIGIAQERFSDGPRMERLDVIFANRYLEAWHAHQSGKSASLVWQVAFRAGRKTHLPVLNHLILGINAHINLDLGIAAAETIAGPDMEPLKEDFDEINRLLFQMVDEVQNKLGELSPLAKWSDWFFRKWDERLAKFSLKKARENAWRVAVEYAKLPQTERPSFIMKEDRKMAAFAALLLGGGPVNMILYALIQLFEKAHNPVEIIQTLQKSTKTTSRSFFMED